MSDGPTRTHVETGRMFGVYRVEAWLGAGGMGEVFRAVDTRLDRRVAIKVCAERFGTRFEQEARAISALNHPHICTLYDIGPDYLVMELLEGSTLSSRIAQGPIPLDEMLQYGVQLADALAEAHAAGIVHRDLKPGNVMVTRHGVKILDFGLAKRIGSDVQTMTRTGVIAGTPAYIAPEQLAGHEATPHSDLFALGLVLYEMAAGRPAVPGGSLGNILFSGGTPVSPPSSGRAGVPAKFDALVDRLLAADPSQRPASAAAVANELHAIAAPPARTNRTAIGASIAAAAIIAVLAAAVWWQMRSPVDAPLQIGEVTTVSVSPGAKRDIAYSPDGSSLVFSWRGDNGDAPALYVMHGQNKPVRLASTTANDVSPAWSPDGKQLAFLRVNPGLTNDVMVLTVADAERGDGTATRVRELRQSEWLTRALRPALTWTPDGRALAVPLSDSDTGLVSLFRVDLDGSAPRRLVASRAQGITSPAFSRDGRWLVFSDFDSTTGITTTGGRQLYIAEVAADGSIGPQQPVPGSRAGSSPSLSPDGSRLVWMSTNQIMEWSRGAEEPRSAYRLTNDGFQSLTVTWTSDTLPRVAFSNLGVRIELRQLPIEDGGRRAGTPTPLMPDLVDPGNPGFSPDGRWFSWAAFNASLVPEIWMAPTTGGDARRIASIASGAPITWSTDSRHLTFHARPPAFAQAFILDIDEQGVATQPPRRVTDTPYDLFGPVFSPDGKWLFVTSVRDPVLHRVVRVPSAGGQIEDLFEGRSQQVSADGRMILYAKPNQRGLWQRSLEGNIAANTETRLIEDHVAPLGYVPGRKGVFYVGRTPAGQPDKIRFFEYASRTSFDLGPAPLLSGGNVFVFGLSPDDSRLVYQTAMQLAPAVTAIAFRR